MGDSRWAHDIAVAEPHADADWMHTDSVKSFLDKYSDVDELWDELESRDTHLLAFRLPDVPAKPQNTLGKTVLMSLYSEFSEDDFQLEGVNLYYTDESVAQDDARIQMPRALPVVGGEEYGEIDEWDNRVSVPRSSVRDLYMIGLAAQFVSEDFETGVKIEQVGSWGREIQERYGFDEQYEFFSSQGERMEGISNSAMVDQALEQAEEEYGE